MQNKPHIFFNYTLEDLEQYLVDNGFKKFNASQLFEWVYQKQVYDFNKMTNISKELKRHMEENFAFPSFKVLRKLVDESDNTHKFLYELEDEQKIETVVMCFNYGNSICVSSQVGCNMGCKFCASGLLKKIRNLEVYEIVNQFVQSEQLFKNKISHIVVMGIGEPLDNFDNLIKALKIINTQKGINLGARHITISTCGLMDKLIDFAKIMPQINVAISLHAATDVKRNQIMPINYKYNIQTIFDKLKEYHKYSNRRISFEYILIKDFNDTNEDAKALIKLMKGNLSYINLIPYNNVDENGFQRSNRVNQFYNLLKKANLNVTIRLERGAKIAAACGQLRAKHEKLSS